MAFKEARGRFGDVNNKNISYAKRATKHIERCAISPSLLNIKRGWQPGLSC